MAEVPFFDIAAGVAPRRAAIHADLDRAIDAGYFVGGAAVARFETDFAAYVGASHCVGLGNGLDALRIGMEALGIGRGDEVIVPGFTFYASWLAVMQTGAVPVPVDVNLFDAGIDVDAVAAVITPATRAVMAVHLYGIPTPLEELRRICDDAGIALIEDAAQSHGARSGELMTGSVGDFAAFSFYPTKNLGALGDAGAITTSSAEIDRVVRSRRSYGQGASKYDHVDTGWNSRLDTIQAVFLGSSLSRLDSRNAQRRVIVERYLDALGPGARNVIGANRLTDSVWHHFVLRVADRDAARTHFTTRGIGTDIHYPYFFDSVEPMSAYPHTADLPNSRRLCSEVLSFPMAPWLSDAQIAQVCEALESLPPSLLAIAD